MTATTRWRSALALCLLAFAGCKEGARSVTSRIGRTLLRAGIRRDGGAPARPMESPPEPRAPTTFRLDRGHTGRSGWRLPRRPRITARVPTGARISAQPIAVGDGGVGVGSHDGMLYVATRSGSVRWRFNTGDRVYTTPAITDDGALLLGTDADRFLAVSGRGRLQVALATEDDADTSPVIARDGTVRFAAGRTLYSATGDLSVRWRLDVGGKIFSSPALDDDGTAYFGSQDNKVYAVDAQGRVAWRFVTGDDVDAPPMLDADNNVYVGSDDGNVYAISHDGAERWRHAVGGFVRAGAALGLDGSVIVATYGLARAARRARTRQRSGALVVRDQRPPTREYGIASAPRRRRRSRPSARPTTPCTSSIATVRTRCVLRCPPTSIVRRCCSMTDSSRWGATTGRSTSSGSERDVTRKATSLRAK
ncbi:MAG: PQQ-binding-like beta-propeller repeat protein [Polyangiales bacterium]